MAVLGRDQKLSNVFRSSAVRGEGPLASSGPCEACFSSYVMIQVRGSVRPRACSFVQASEELMRAGMEYRMYSECKKL
ncbi:UNVERIFIED_CONTAM: hypothetical protein Sangu_1869400 [Sesamum angustifolium]|uniref:Uncharacterized protein n=1 Tax=Sesamum angustifolium TaxID=2727405 RepID=A0AAW2LTW2_9LAMI